MSEGNEKRSARRIVLVAAAVGGVVALVLFGGFNVLMGHTNTMEFCISCHEMADTPYEEYKKSFHYQNRIGVRAECPDCHVPRAFWPKMAAKIVAAKDVWHHLLGTIDTKEKFAEHRLTMAKRVWAKMEATGSRECKECHDFGAMNLDEQGRRARRKHPTAIQEGQHCINCHKFVVHDRPPGYEGD